MGALRTGPYAHAEATPLPVLAERLGCDLDDALTALRAAGIAGAVPKTSLARLARTNDTTPAALFALLEAVAPSGAPAGVEPSHAAAPSDRNPNGYRPGSDG